MSAKVIVHVYHFMGRCGSFQLQCKEGKSLGLHEEFLKLRSSLIEIADIDGT